MGTLINPVSERLGITHYWNSTWVVSLDENFGSLLMDDAHLMRYTNKIIKIVRRRAAAKRGIAFVAYKSLRISMTNYFLLYIKIRGIIKILKSIKLVLRDNKKNALKTNRLIKSLCKKKKNYIIKNLNNKKLETERLLLENNNNKNFSTNSFLYKNLKKTPRHNIYQRILKPADVYLKAALFYQRTLSAPEYQKAYNNNSKLIRIRNYTKILNKILIYTMYSVRLGGLQNFIRLCFNKLYASRAPKILFVILNITTLTADFVARFIIIRLKYQFPIRPLLKTIVSQLRRFVHRSKIIGFKIVCSGRFERRGRATYTWKQIGKIPNTNLNIKLDYSLQLVTLTNSLCAVKVWLALENQPKKTAIL